MPGGPKEDHEAVATYRPFCQSRAAGLVLMEPWAYCDDEHRSRLENWIEMLNETQDVPLFSEDLIRHYFSAKFVKSSPEKIRFYEAIRNEQSVNANLQDCRACLSFDLRPRLNEIKVPTALIYGEDCGHMPFIECPEAFNRILGGSMESMEEGVVPLSLRDSDPEVCLIEAFG